MQKHIIPCTLERHPKEEKYIEVLSSLLSSFWPNILCHKKKRALLIGSEAVNFTVY